MQIFGIILAIVLFLLLVVIHEGGHFLAAKACGVGVPEFSLGFGPLIYEKQKGETQYSVRAIPLGGYCRLEGDEEDENPNPNALNRAPWYKQVIIMAAGPLFNILFCLVILSAVFLYSGSTSTILDEVTVGGPAYEAGLQSGDIIVSMNGQEINTWSDFRRILNTEEGTLDIGYLRSGEEGHALVTPTFSEETGRYMTGVTCKILHSPVTAVKSAFVVSGDFFSSVKSMITGLFHGNTEDVELSGVVGLVSVISEEAKYGAINVIFLMGIISLNLGVMNLMPIPALDGGRILLVLIKAVSGNRLPQKIIDSIHAGGMIFLWIIMIYLIFKDTFKYIIK